jgi:hypothetical protein
MENRGAFAFEEWCRYRGFCRATGYNLLKRGKGPKIIKVGARTIVTVEADAEWVARMQAETAGNAA